MKKLLIAVLCLMLTGCAAPAPSDGSGPDRSVSPDIPAPSPAASSAPNGESGPPQASPETDPETAENPSASQEPSESSLGPQNQEQIIQELLSAMTLEEKVGQMFFVRCPETGGAELAAQYKVGGYLLFGRDFKDKTAQQVRDDIQSYQDASGIPLLIGTDEEGGTVERVSSNPHLRASKFPSPQKAYASGGMEAVLADTREKDLLLSALGFNVNLSPVADVSTNPADFMYDRTFGQDAAATADYVAQVVSQMAEDGMGSVLKHFPGYGNNVDTHTGIAVDQRPLESFTSSDFLPFQAGMESGGGKTAVLVSHNIMTAVDGDLPASLSPKVHGLLRTDLGFDGVVMTDDLAMEAVAAYSADGAVAVMALEAGNDLVITTDYRTQIPKVLEALESGALSEETIDTACRRVLTWKQNLGLL